VLGIACSAQGLVDVDTGELAAALADERVDP
jgi:hypothetical protein